MKPSRFGGFDPRTWDVKTGAIWLLVVTVGGGLGGAIDWTFKMGEKIDAIPPVEFMRTSIENDSLLDARVSRLERRERITTKQIRTLKAPPREGWIRRLLRRAL